MLFTLDVKTAIALYTLIPVAVLVSVWIISELLRRPLRFTLERKFLWQCDTCTYIYINIKIEDSSLSVCPRCGSYNKRPEPKTKDMDVRQLENERKGMRRK